MHPKTTEMISNANFRRLLQMAIALAAFTAFVSLPIHQANAAIPGDTSCDQPWLARELAQMNHSEWVLDCYWSLSDGAKRALFPKIVKEAGVSLDDLTRDFQLMSTPAFSRSLEAIPLAYQPITPRPTIGEPSTNLTSGSGSWVQWLERVPFSALFATLINAGGLWRDQYWCDGTSDPDLDAIYVYYFPSAVSNPDAVRSFAPLQYPLVDAMLVYYGFGVNGSGYTWSSIVYACVGESAVNWLGEGYIYNGLKLHR